MKEIIITTQEQLDKITEVRGDEYLIVETELKLNCKLSVFGKALFKAKIDCSWGLGFFVVARGNSSVVAWENSSVEAWGNSRVVAWENSSVEAWEIPA